MNAPIILDKPYIYQQQLETSIVEIESYVDNPVYKWVIANLQYANIGGNEYSGQLTLWSGAEYDAIGQWTDAEARVRIKQLLES